MLDSNTRDEIAAKIFHCHQSHQQLPLLSESYADFELADAYAIQKQVLSRFVANNDPIKGYKIGLTSKVMQEMAGTNEPDYSAIPASFFFDESTAIARVHFNRPIVEIELAFIIGSELNGEQRESGSSAAVLGNPLTAVRWLADKIAAMGHHFAPGNVILSGSFVRALPVEAGDSIVARFDNDFGDVAIEMV